jgi:hypothetical protein
MCVLTVDILYGVGHVLLAVDILYGVGHGQQLKDICPTPYRMSTVKKHMSYSIQNAHS